MAAALIALWLSAGVPAARADACTDKAVSQADLNDCALKSYQAADAELNRLYRQIERRLHDDGDARKRLVAAQHAWVAFRDAECAFASGDGGSQGSAFPMVKNTCLSLVTEKRIEDLKAYLSCKEGDLGCPVPAE